MRGSGKADIYAMLAHPLSHTKSPSMFNALFEEKGLDSLMVPITCRPEELGVLWNGLTAMENLKGVIVSVPFKKAIYERCDSARPLAARVESANCVRRLSDGSWEADNFDGVGFIQGLYQGGHTISGRHILQVGAGGAGGSLAYCLAEEGAASVTIHDIDPTRAAALAELVSNTFPACRVNSGPPRPDGHSMVINATPMGLRPEDPVPVDTAGLTPDMTVVDIIMDPRETPLLKHAAATGCSVQYGQPMMDCQMQAMAEFLGIEKANK